MQLAYYQSCLVTLTKGMLLKFRSFAPSKKQVKTEMRRWNLFNHFSWTRCCLADEKSFLKLDLDMGLAKISLRMHLTDYVTVENSGSNELIIFCFLYEYFLLLVSSLLHLYEYNFTIARWSYKQFVSYIWYK